MRSYLYSFLNDLQTFLLLPRKETSETFSKWYAPIWTSLVPSGHQWLESRRALEGSEESLWRIGDNLYDLNEFVDKHPGGRQWLQLTRGTDVTELFESHHIREEPRRLLPKFFVKSTKIPRNSPFTFHPDGFYATLRNRVRAKLQNESCGPSLRSKLYFDISLVVALSACAATSLLRSHSMAFLAGVLLNSMTIAAHNFFHQKDNWRMYCFNISGLSTTRRRKLFCVFHHSPGHPVLYLWGCLHFLRGSFFVEWRISHAMSHHMYPNSHYDLEISLFEPWLQWIPRPKAILFRYLPWLYSPIAYIALVPVSIITRWIKSDTDGPLEALVLAVPLALAMGNSSIGSTLYWWAIILLFESFMFGLVGINAGHHHHEVFHEGDNVKSDQAIDWGIFQMITVRDRIELKERIFGLSFFGDHRLHHMFPTLDHDRLPQLYPEFVNTCEEFGVKLVDCSFWEAIWGQFLQLARVNKLSFPY